MSRHLVIDDLWALKVPSDPTMSPDGTRVVFVLGGCSRHSDRIESSLWQAQVGGGAVPGVEAFTSDERTVTTPDGTEIHALVLRDPLAARPGPVLLDVHGGPHNAWSSVLDTARLYQQELVAAGWTVLLVNARGSDGYGERFYRGLISGWGISDAGDFTAALDNLVAEGIADPARQAITGYSYGGYTTCWLTTQTDRFAAAIAGGCVSDPQSLAGTSDQGNLSPLLSSAPHRGTTQPATPNPPRSSTQPPSRPPHSSSTAKTTSDAQSAKPNNGSRCSEPDAFQPAWSVTRAAITCSFTTAAPLPANTTADNTLVAQRPRAADPSQ